MTEGESGAKSRLRRWIDSRRRWSFEEERLKGAIDDFAVQHLERGLTDAGWARRAARYLEQANAERAVGHFDAAWSNLKAAQRELIESADETELLVEVDRVFTEATAKLSGWRLEMVKHTLDSPWNRLGDAARVRHAVTSALAEVTAESDPSSCEDLRRRIGLAVTEPEPRPKDEEIADLVTRLKEARRILEDHQDNVYRKLRILRHHVRVAAALLLATLAITLVVLGQGWTATNGPTLFSDWHSVVVVMVLGALGAALSGVLVPLSRDQDQQIPDVLSQSLLAWVRPLVGAGAAVIVVAILRSGIAGLSIDDAAVPVAALAAGFSERLVGQSVATASAALGK